METNRGTKVIAVIALVVAVVGVSLGFAAFSNNLAIKSEATVTPDKSTFNVDFSSSGTAQATEAVTPTKSVETLVATDATINNTADPTISGLSATFTEPGQSVTYSFYAHNVGQYEAFLKSITYANAEDGNAPKVCTKTGEATDDLVSAACEGIKLTVKVGTDAEVNGSKASITGHSLAKDAFEPIVVKIEYTAGSDRADGDFSVKFGDISLAYSSVD